MPAPVTAATIPITQQAQRYFLEAVCALDQIITQVFESQAELTSSAMITTAGARFGRAVIQWTEEFNDIRKTLDWMAQQLGDTAQQMLANEQHNTDIAAGLAAVSLPSSFGGMTETPMKWAVMSMGPITESK